MSNTEDVATHAIELELLRTQLISCRARLATQTRAYHRATAVLQQYLELLVILHAIIGQGFSPKGGHGFTPE